MDMRKLTQEMRLKHWLGVLRERNDSGKSIRAYCKEHGINEKSYYYWQRRLRETAAKTSSYSDNTAVAAIAEPRFTEINLPVQNKNSAITIRIGNAVVEIEGQADRQTIEAILQSLC